LVLPQLSHARPQRATLRVLSAFPAP
jgi:hypothetical protein